METPPTPPVPGPTFSTEGFLPPPPPPRRRPRRWLHALLLTATACTVLFAGSLWENAYGEAESILGAALLAILHPSLLLAGLPFAASLLSILGAHEMGHYLACRRHGIPASLPYFIPAPPPFGTFGAVIRIRGWIPDRRALFDVAAAGPLAGFCVALPLLVLGLLSARPIPAELANGSLEFGSPLVSALLERLLFGDSDIAVGSVYLAGWFGMLVTSLNLFPAGQLDGGHAAYAVSARLHRHLARITVVGVVLLVAAQTLLYRTLSAYTLWCAVLLFMRDRHPRLLDESVPLDRPRRVLAAVLLLIFVLCFIPLPIRL